MQDAICGQLAEMTGRNCTRPVDSALEIGSGTGFLTRRMLELYPHALWTINDLVEQSADFLEPYAAGHDVRYLWGDAETIALPDRLDLILRPRPFSGSTICRASHGKRGICSKRKDISC